MNALARTALAPPANGFIGPRLAAWCSSLEGQHKGQASTTWPLAAHGPLLGAHACASLLELHAVLLQAQTATCGALRFDLPTIATVDDDNSFVRVLQHAHDVLDWTALAELFAGTVCVARATNGERMHVASTALSSSTGAIYRCSPALRLTAAPFLDLDEVVYVAAVAHAVEVGAVSAALGQQWLEPTVLRTPARFPRVGDDEDDDGLLAGALPHPDAYLDRARWLLEVLGTLPMLTSSFTLPHEPEVLARRVAAAKRWVPSALYWLWHTFLLDEDEVALFLDVARAHRARVVRDAADVVQHLQHSSDVPGMPAAWCARVLQWRDNRRARVVALNS